MRMHDDAFDPYLTNTWSWFLFHTADTNNAPNPAAASNTSRQTARWESASRAEEYRETSAWYTRREIRYTTDQTNTTGRVTPENNQMDDKDNGFVVCVYSCFNWSRNRIWLENRTDRWFCEKIKQWTKWIKVYVVDGKVRPFAVLLEHISYTILFNCWTIKH